MLRRWIWSTPPAALAVLCAGCHGGSFTLNVHDHRPARVKYVHHSHVCTHACHDHYYDGRGVIVIRGGHRHSPHCGHHWDGRYWVVVRKGKPHKRVIHVCSRSCHHHYHDGAKLVVIDGNHRHGRGCGHRWTGKHWVTARKDRSRSHDRAEPRKATPKKKKERRKDKKKVKKQKEKKQKEKKKRSRK